MEPLISVIVPVYNEETYLDECIESIVNQTYGHLEILVVDDGSTDSSGDKCDRWAERDERIRVIHQPNGGHSAARNTALDAAKGEIITMVDSDDVMHPELIATLLEVMQKTGSDITVANYVAFDTERPVFPSGTGSGKIRQYNQKEALMAIFYQHGFDHSPWGRLYKAHVLEHIRFPQGIIYEDLAIIYPVLKKCNLVTTVERVLYGYRQHDNSSMKVFSPRRSAVLDVCEDLERTMQANDPQYLFYKILYKSLSMYWCWAIFF